MDFFARQRAARGLTRRLVVLFVLAVLAVVLAIDAVVLTTLAVMQSRQPGAAPISPLTWITGHPDAAVITSLIVIAIIGLASLYKTSMLRGGGGVVARSLGGERVSPETTDPLRRRLLNVVEEISIASGVPVPEVYVLEHETGINAFAAGHTPANAAIAVTRGTLETLNRAELQGVIAHEFSHVLNGDMRLNIRLMGLLYGLLIVALIARLVLRFTPHRGGGNRKDGGAIAAIMVAAMAVLVLGYVGLFFGRLIQAAVSRGRETLADASAVQFTRDPNGLRGALVKIGAVAGGSQLQDADADEVAHMLFAAGISRMFATHPPLLDRIKAIDPRFDPKEIEQVRARIASGRVELAATPEEPEATAADRLERMLGTAVVLGPATVAGLVGNPGTAQIDAAHSIRASLPESFTRATARVADARNLLFALALDRSETMRRQQLAHIEQQLGAEAAGGIRNWSPAADALNVLQRQPALLLLLPALRQLSRTERERLLACLHGLLTLDGEVSVEDYALLKLAQVQLQDASAQPVAARAGLPSLSAELGTLFAILAQHGHADPNDARRAYEAGISTLLPLQRPGYRQLEQWQWALDNALDRLDRLAPAGKQLLLEALVRTIAHDQKLTVREAELLRTICASLHCPLPPLVAVDPGETPDV